MTRSHHKYFHEIDPPTELEGRIIERVHISHIRKARIRLALLSGTTLSALSATPAALSYLSQESVQSGFTEYMSLLWSDADILLVHWKEFALSITESLPLTGMTVMLALAFLLLWSLPRAITYGRIAFEKSEHAFA